MPPRVRGGVLMDFTEAETALEAWRQRREHVEAERDQLIRDAYAAGVNIRQIHIRSGIGRNTVYRVLGVELATDPEREL